MEIVDKSSRRMELKAHKINGIYKGKPNIAD